MKIEIRNLKIMRSLSEETTAYTATIYVDGKPAFDASNHGHGGCDFYRPLGDVTEQQVNAWLAENEAPDGPFEADPAKRALYDNGSLCDLETFVCRFLAQRERDDEAKRIGKKLDKFLKDKVTAINEEGNLITFKAAPTPANIAAISDRYPAYRVVNGGDEATRDAALRAYCPDLFAASSFRSDTVEAVYERLRENRLTAADARYLKAENDKAKKPCPDLNEALLLTIAEGERRDAEHKAALEARRSA